MPPESTYCKSEFAAASRQKAEAARRGYLLSQQDDVVESSCLDLRLSLQQIYEGVELPPPGVGELEPPEYEVVE